VSWIKLKIRAGDPRIVLLSELTGASAERVFYAVVGRWFWWIDDHAEDANIRITYRAFRDEMRWNNDKLANAMQDERVDWLEEIGGLLAPTRWESNMSKGAKVRAETAKRVGRVRETYSNGNANSVTKSVPREEKRREENTAPPPPSETVWVLAENAKAKTGGGGGGGAVVLTPDQTALYQIIAPRPDWLPEGTPWIDAVKARDIAALPTTTPALIAYYAKETRRKVRTLDSPGGFFITRMEKPDAGVIQSLQHTQTGGKA
jgi:hypothetical protein